MIINVPIFRNSGDEIGSEIILDNLVIIDDLFDTVRDKIFYEVNSEERDGYLYKNLLKYELVSGNGSVVLKKNIQLLFYLDKIEHFTTDDTDDLTNLFNNMRIDNKETTETYKGVYIRVTNIFDVIKDDFYSVYLLGENSEQLDELFNKYNVEFVELTKQDLWYCIMAHVFSNNDIQLSGNDSKEKVDKIFDEFTNYLEDAYKRIKRKMDELTNELSNYYKQIKALDIDISRDIKYNTLSVEYRPNDFITGTKGRFINLSTIFNVLQLNINIPFVLLNARIN
jgi:hypothetical protein